MRYSIAVWPPFSSPFFSDIPPNQRWALRRSASLDCSLQIPHSPCQICSSIRYTLLTQGNHRAHKYLQIPVCLACTLNPLSSHHASCNVSANGKRPTEMGTEWGRVYTRGYVHLKLPKGLGWLIPFFLMKNTNSSLCTILSESPAEAFIFLTQNFPGCLLMHAS